MEGLLNITTYILVLLLVPVVMVLWVYAGKGLARVIGIEPKSSSISVYSVFGFLLFCIAIVATKLFVASWTITLALVATVAAVIGRKETSFAKEVVVTRNFYSLHWLAWSVVNLVLAISIFDLEKGISTLWKNNYGDITFHLGMISNMMFNPSGIFQFHLAVGEPLNYPIFVNLITAAFWSLSPNIATLKSVSVFMWLWSSWLLWGAFRASIWVWPVLFGGASIYFWGSFSSEFIEYNGFWTSFLSTVWVPQRTSWAGVAVASVLLSLLFSLIDNRRLTYKNTVFLGFIWGVSAMVHFHASMIAGLVGGMFVVFFSSESIKKRIQLGTLLASGAAGGALLFLPWFSSKSSSLEGMYCLSTHKGNFEPLQQCILSLFSWGVQLLPLWCLLYALFAFRARDEMKLGRKLLVFLVLFIFGNSVKMAYWNWDQIKLFIGLYVSLLLFFALYRERIFNNRILSIGSVVVAIVLSLPSLCEVVTYVREDNYQVFSPQDILDADKVRNALAPGEPILSGQEHNNAMLLSGHPLYVGYPGTLWSHGMQQLSEKRMAELENLCNPSLPRFAYARQGEFLNKIRSSGCFFEHGDGLWQRQQ